ncbi:MAG: redoxin domain-containing protein [Lysobacter sp.]|nr:redoxin domain-containing protein [Lysobacter sp.]
MSSKARTAQRSRQGPPLAVIAGVVVVAAIALFAIFLANGGGNGGEDGTRSVERGSGLKYAVGNPGPGEPAPPLRLASTNGTTFDLAEQRGRRVMLYFQEGLMCQPCWDQMVDIEARWSEFQDEFGIDEMVAITSDPVDVLAGKVQLEGLQSAVLSDPGVAVSKTYEANLYGMMGTSMNGHSFVIVGPDGRIEWRADYGGKPDHTMFVPVDGLLADMRAGMPDTAASS